MPELHCTLNYFIAIIGLTHYSSSFVSASTSVMSVKTQVKMSNSRTSNQGKETVQPCSPLCLCKLLFFIQLTVLMEKKADVCLLHLSVNKHIARQRHHFLFQLWLVLHHCSVLSLSALALLMLLLLLKHSHKKDLPLKLYWHAWT